MVVLLLTLAAAEGRPLFYWGARPPMIQVEAASPATTEAQVVEVHAALDRGSLVLRFSFDRPIGQAIALPGGAPVSGRLRAVLYVDGDDDRRTGLDQGPRDARTGADQRLEIGVVTLGEDPEEKRPASAVVAATLAALTPDGRRRTLWRGDDAANPANVSAHGEWLEVRLPPEHAPRSPRPRLIFAAGDRTWDGRLKDPGRP